MGFFRSMFGKREPYPPRTLQEYLGIDSTGRAEMAMRSRRAAEGALLEHRRVTLAHEDQAEFVGMGEVPRSLDETRGYAFVRDLFTRNSGEQVSAILDKMVGYSQMLRRGDKS